MSDAKVEAAPKAKKNILLFAVIGLLVVLLIIVGGVAAFLLTKSSDPAADEVAAEATAREDVKKKKKKGKKEEHAAIFEKLPQFTVNLHSEEGDGILQTDISVEIADAQVAEKIKGQMPKIQGQVNKLLRSKTISEVKAVDGTDKLGKEIRELINKILHAESEEEGVISVNFTTFIVQ
ncbi:flagellar basal body-associated FliL family protein [Iodobacter ciconiae]|uniref:Flagellar protein FliL n=1 Tax=Iodobacter ciconiae TaxID=2496266 RepID=A0A3S8ZWZ5_9NEIS|nr:flagellar basal body-associated FliL family protein [Iodobacter ciconiae]AZN37934.1 flagellar basal body protein FliL [Iodobacter ciconiae]